MLENFAFSQLEERS